MRPQTITDDRWMETEALGLARRPSAARPPMPQADTQAVLTRAVRDEVIPRLVLARHPQPPAESGAQGQRHRPTAAQVATLVSVVLDGSQTEATGYVEAVRDGGATTESLFLDLLTPTARQLGRMWEDDTCSFSDVTLGMIRLGNVMRLLGRAFADDYDPARAGPSVLLAQMPGEQHGFGLAMVAQFFRRAGWNVREAHAASSQDLASMVAEHWFGIVGLSVACSDRLESLAADIATIRRQSRNRQVGVMVGGPPFVVHPQLAGMVGADATAADGHMAVRHAQRLVGEQARQG